MKRLFILSAAVAALASCSNSEVITEVNEPQVPDKAIAFETFSSNATRAENSQGVIDDGLENHHSDFSVWGYKDVQDTYVFGTEGSNSTDQSTEGVEVSYGQTSSPWTYSPIRFWDKSANFYEFYACAPATTSGTGPYFVLNKNTDAKNDDYFTLNDVKLENFTLIGTSYVHSMKGQVQNSNSGNTTDGNIDYMIADPCHIAKSSIGDAVQLHFNHILSRLNVTVHKSSNLSDFNVSLNSLEVCNLMSKGSFNENSVNTNLASGTTGRWSNTSDPITYVGNAITTSGGLVGESANPKYVLQSLVIPQKIAFQAVERSGKVKDSSSGTETERVLTSNDAPYIKLKYTISVENGYTESFEAYFNLAAAFGATDGNEVCFNEGWQNTLNIIIDASEISFSADVYKWDDNKVENLNTETGHVPSTGGN